VTIALVFAACGDGAADQPASTPATTGAPTTTTAGAPSTTAPPETTSAASPAALPMQACDLLTPEEVAAYVPSGPAGEPGGLAQYGGSPLVDDCIWQDPDTFASFSIQLFGDGRALSDMDFSDEAQGVVFETAPYDGIGDEALTLTEPDSGVFNSLWVQQGAFVLVCYPDPFADVPVEIDGAGWDAFFSLCQTALGRL
jgi:hypothetical protein